MATIKTVENLTAGDIATFKQEGKLGQFRRWTHEKVTGSGVVGDAIAVETVDKGGFTATYLIPAGTEMRVHNTVQVEREADEDTLDEDLDDLLAED